MLQDDNDSIAETESEKRDQETGDSERMMSGAINLTSGGGSRPSSTPHHDTETEVRTRTIL